MAAHAGTAQAQGHREVEHTRNSHDSHMRRSDGF